MSGVAVLLFFVCPSSLAIVSRLYKANPLHNDKLFNESLAFESPSSSLLYCASMCGSNCGYYGFNFETKKCRVHTCSTLVDAVGEAGWRYYSSNDPDFKPEDCQAVYRAGHRRSGVHRIYQAACASTDVFCDMETMGGGWTIIQKRFDGSVNFNRTWEDYKNGFGSATGEYWIGNDMLHRWTSLKPQELRVDMENFVREKAYAVYSNFSVGDEASKYQLQVNGCNGTAGDSLDYHNNMKFSTPDQDNDVSSSNCATDWRSGWWFKYCMHANPNGQYTDSEKTGDPTYIVWYKWKNSYISLKSIQLMIRPRA